MWNLYSAPLATPGMNPSQMPDEPRELRRCVFGSQPLKLPTTETDACVGRPHAEDGAGLTVMSEEVRSHLFVEAIITAFVEEVEILVGQKLRRA